MRHEGSKVLDDGHVDAGDIRMVLEQKFLRRKFVDLHLPAVGAYQHHERKTVFFPVCVGGKIIAVRLLAEIEKFVQVVPVAIHAGRSGHPPILLE